MEVESVMTLRHEQLQILRHMLGIDDPRFDPPPYRDYYCATPGDAHLHELQWLGAVRLYCIRDGYEWFCCTDAGRAAAMASVRSIRKPKGKRLYAAFLNLKDCWPDLTFGAFLTDQALRRLRDEA
jgi:hypothetical protein